MILVNLDLQKKINLNLKKIKSDQIWSKQWFWSDLIRFDQIFFPISIWFFFQKYISFWKTPELETMWMIWTPKNIISQLLSLWNAPHLEKCWWVWHCFIFDSWFKPSKKINYNPRIYLFLKYIHSSNLFPWSFHFFQLIFSFSWDLFFFLWGLQQIKKTTFLK